MGACREASTAEGEVYTTTVLGIRWRSKSLYLYVDVEVILDVFVSPIVSLAFLR